ncbi:SCO-spondin [Anabarilius grahami]|uniref:SCO-spondin n=1 Tax=Anabarilius grahami TaxID=495550 RepID=A0A3N0XKH5_ANAGA|nr:SCO-spondin [Anabarilius grahami]
MVSPRVQREVECSAVYQYNTQGWRLDVDRMRHEHGGDDGIALYYKGQGPKAFCYIFKPPDIETETVNRTLRQCCEGWGGPHCSQDVRSSPVIRGVRDPQASGTCMSWGGTHYRTFDRKHFHFQGSCTYLLASSTDGTWAVYTSSVCDTAGHCRKGLRMMLGLGLVSIQKGNLTLNGLALPQGEPLFQNGVSVHWLGDFVFVESGLGVRLKFDMENTVYLTVTAEHLAATRGLCGVYNNNPDDDFTTSGGSVSQYAASFGNSWRVQDQQAQVCSDAAELGHSCDLSSDVSLRRDAEAACHRLKESPFSHCHHQVDPGPYIDTCLYLYCSLDVSERDTAVCDTLASYVRECATQHVIIRWRTAGFCERVCPSGQVFSDCVSSCPPSCSSPGPPASGQCRDECVGGCECPPGLFLHGQCLRRDDCPCFHRRRTYSAGDTIRQRCNTCVCRAGQWECSGERCEAQCAVIGAMQVTTFDRKRYGLQGGDCQFTAVEDFVDQKLSVRISGGQCAGGAAGCLRELTVTALHTTISVTDSGSVMVNGQRELLPVITGDLMVRKPSSSVLLIQAFGAQLMWHLDGPLLLITLQPGFAHKVRGLCGTLTWSQHDDFTTPEGDVENSVSSFAAKFRTGSCPLPSAMTSDPCGTYTQRRQYAESVCSVIHSSVFQACHDVVDREPYMRLCLSEVCSCGPQKSCQCIVLAAYTRQCAQEGAPVSWRNRTFCSISLTTVKKRLAQLLFHADFNSVVHFDSVCREQRWHCGQALCAGTCVATGDPHYITFDGRYFSFLGDCEYVLAQETSGLFSVSAENVPCGSTGVTCTKSVTLTVGNTAIHLLRGKAVTVNGIPVTLPKSYSGSGLILERVGLFVSLSSRLGVTLLWDGGMRVYVRLTPHLGGRVRGLCGNFDGDAENDFTTRQGIMESTPELFGNSWKISPSCPDVADQDLRDPCVINPHRVTWAKKKCAVISQEIFSSCHSEVPYQQYYDWCVFDACGCDSGGDCECLCTAVAAYAEECNRRGAYVRWRSQELCPLAQMVCGVVLDLRVLLRLPARTQSFAAPPDLSAVFPLSGSVIMKTTVATVPMRSVRPPVRQVSSVAPVAPVYRWSSGVTAIRTALTNRTRTSVRRPHQKPAVQLESSDVLTDAVCRHGKSVMGGWIVDLLMILMSMVSDCCFIYCGAVCRQDEFRCSSGRCVLYLHRCDGHDDCGDYSDERECVCALGELQCPGDQCVPAERVCDGHRDCPSGVDELICPVKGCSRFEFSCTSGQCVPIAWRCDGETDCLDGSDEKRCSRTCQLDQFLCQTGDQCIQHQQLCDGTPHCRDASDESVDNCDKVNPSTAPPSEGNTSRICPEFTCADGSCVPFNTLCNGAADCPSDPSDEMGCGVWSPWSPWSPCSRSCGSGTMSRQRRCSPEDSDGRCRGEKTQRQQCYSTACPVDGYWLPWATWSNCSKGCGGVEIRQRECFPPQNGGRTCAELPGETNLTTDISCWCPDGTVMNHEQQCVLPEKCVCEVSGVLYWPGQQVKVGCDICVFHCGWSSWSLWGECLGPCGVQSVQWSFRSPNNPTKHGNGRQCRGIYRKARRCQTEPCSECEYRGHTYAVGERWKGGQCLLCQCLPNFTVQCGPYCPYSATGCPQPGHPPSAGRLHARDLHSDLQGWSPEPEQYRELPAGTPDEGGHSSGPYLQIDLLRRYNITGLLTQGGGVFDTFVSSFYLQFSSDGRQWYTYKEMITDARPKAKVFQGNSDDRGVALARLDRMVSARFVRILPHDFQNGIYLRVELMGCADEHEQSTPALPLRPCREREFLCRNGRCVPAGPQGALCDGFDDCGDGTDEENCGGCIEAERRCDGVPHCPDGADERDCTHTNITHITPTAAPLRTPSKKPVTTTVDFLEPTWISGVVTQGSERMWGYLTKYRLAFALADNHFINFTETGDRDSPPKVFEVRMVGRTPVTRWLDRLVRARFLRIIPVEFRPTFYLRVEVLGCRGDELVTPSSEVTTAPPGGPGLQNHTGPTGRPGYYNYTSGPPGLHTKSPQDGSPGVAPPTRITTAPPGVGPTREPGVHILTTPYSNRTDTSTPFDDGLPRVLCVKGQFSCRTFGCVEAALVCDGREDCPDGSDEDRCGPVTPSQRPLLPERCSSKQFSCWSGECVSSEKRCDLHRDCADGSDESDCCLSGYEQITWCFCINRTGSRLIVFLFSVSVDGQWSEWTQWSGCDVPCGGGLMVRNRTCSNPPPKNGGRDCDGMSRQTHACHMQSCGPHTDTQSGCTGGMILLNESDCLSGIIDACPVTCSDLHSERNCTLNCSAGCYCPPGLFLQDGRCVAASKCECLWEGSVIRPGQEVSSSSCSSCVCKDGRVTCDDSSCVARCDWSAWSSWTSCDSSCGTGIQHRYRWTDLYQDSKISLNVTRSSSSRTDCDPSGPDGVSWSDWTPWSECSKTCFHHVDAVGLRRRFRSCNHTDAGASCGGDVEEHEPCNMIHCPVSGGWSSWSSWSDCSSECDSGVQTRERFCSSPPPLYGGLGCPGPHVQTRDCNVLPCSVDCGWSEWTTWSACSRTCDVGIRRRYRSGTNPAPAFGGRACEGDRIGLDTCSITPCFGVKGPWSPWSECSVPCGGGYRSRTRGPLRTHGTPQQFSACNLQPCGNGSACTNGQEWAACVRDELLCSDLGSDVQRDSSCHPGCQCPEGSALQWTAAGHLGLRGVCVLCRVALVFNRAIASVLTRSELGTDFPASGRTERTECVLQRPAAVSDPQTLTQDPRSHLKKHNNMILQEHVRLVCPVVSEGHGGWSGWTSWTDCTKSCGGGVRSRRRDCDRPIRGGDGDYCEGLGTEVIMCNTDHCPGVCVCYCEWRCEPGCYCTDGKVLNSDGSECVERDACPCLDLHTGRRVRPGDTVRSPDGCNNWECNSPPARFGGLSCLGESRQSRGCHDNVTVCSDCGGGQEEWPCGKPCPRSCSDLHGDTECVDVPGCSRTCGCPGDMLLQDGVCVDRELCRCKFHNISAAGIDTGNVSWEWPGTSDWQHANPGETVITDCHNCTCEAGVLQCDSLPGCSVDGSWSQWAPWSECSAHCGGGVKERTRQCDNPAPQSAGRECVGSGRQQKVCNTHNCSGGECERGEGCPFSCSQVSGHEGCYSEGCEEGCHCPPNTFQHNGSCLHECPCLVDTDFLTSLQSVSVTPELTPDLQNITVGSELMSGEELMHECSSCSCEHGLWNCSLVPCTRDGGLSPWGPWGPCSLSCGGLGQKSRSRSCNQPSPAHGGRDCEGPLLDTAYCQTPDCPHEDAGFSQWTVWSPCSRTCNNPVSPAQKFRTRECVDDRCSGKSRQERVCNLPQCPDGGVCQGPECAHRNCSWMMWGEWSSCSRSCGVGQQQRVRTFIAPGVNGTWCQDILGGNVENRFCSIRACRVDGGWSRWSPWSRCDKACGGGRSIRTRSCSSPPPKNGGRKCTGEKNQVDGGWTPWSVWSDCPVTCGKGKQIRTRACINPPPRNNGTDCTGPERDTQDCHAALCLDDLCPWSPWSPCSRSCGAGVISRRRQCVCEEDGDHACPPELQRDGEETQLCYKRPCPACTDRVCPVYSPWGSWSECSVSCGTGQRTRRRSCTHPTGGPSCTDTLQSESCSPSPCPAGCVVSEWSSWSDCSASCGGGVSLRRKTVLREPEPGGLTCPGPLEQHTACNTNNCLPDCPAGQVISTCAGSCPYSCEDLWPENQCVPATCSPGCSCPPGAVMLNGTCVPQSQCPCSVVSLLSASPNVTLDHQEKEVPAGTVIPNSCNSCVCDGGLFTCTNESCDVDCEWSSWSAWSSCSASCGSGQQFSSRTIRRQRQYGGQECEGPSHTSRVCRGPECECPEDERWFWSVSGSERLCERGCVDLYRPEPLNCTGPGATEGCVCEEGRYRSLEGRCVIPALCQCEEEDGTLREPGSEWVDGCQSCRCINGQKHCQSSCPPLHCSEGEVKVLEAEDCCPVCRREYPEDPVAECRRYTEVRNITKGDCRLDNVEVSFCRGRCLSRTDVILEEPYLQAFCDCCSYRLDPQNPVIFLSLQCASGDVEPVVLPVIHSCECTSCQGG